MSAETTPAKEAQEKLAARNEILVALPHERPVLDVFGGNQLVEVTARNEILGLARVRVTNVDVAAARIADQAEQVAKRAQPNFPRWEPRDEALDQVLLGLRVVLADRHSGWVPTIGKNRLIGQVDGKDITETFVIGTGRISHGGGPEPEPLPPQTWLPRGTGPGAGARVGLLDTPLASRPWLSGGWVSAYTDRLQPGQAPSTRAGHATFIAGLILYQAPGALLDVRQVLDAGTATADSWDAAIKIVELGRAGLDVLNLSFVCYTENGQPPMALATALDRLDPAIVVVAAAGNHGADGDPANRNRPAWPAALDDVIAVGAATPSDQPGQPGTIADFTPHQAPWIDVLAPGVGLHSTFLEGTMPLGDPTGEPKKFEGFATWGGSSFAAAVVSGIIAAGVQPGRVSAHESWQAIRTWLPQPKVTEDSYTPPYLSAETPPLTTPGDNNPGRYNDPKTS